MRAENTARVNAFFWSTVAPELVDLVLRPLKVGPPLLLPEHGDDAVWPSLSSSVTFCFILFL